MTIRSAVVVGILVLGSGAFALAQGGRVPGLPVDALRQGPAKTTLTTSPVSGQFYACRLLNVGKSPLSPSATTIKLFDPFGNELVPGPACEGPLLPGHTCQKFLGIDGLAPQFAYCQISFNGDSDNVRGALQAYPNLGEGVSVVVEAR